MAGMLLAAMWALPAQLCIDTRLRGSEGKVLPHVL